MKKQIILFLIILLVLASCSNKEQQQSQSSSEESSPPQAGLGVDLTQKGPWNGSLYTATSSEGITFEKGNLVLDHAGVPNLLLTSSGELILIYQLFSFEDTTMFDVIAYSTSDDNGKTWGSPQKITFEELPDSIGAGKVPMDPTLVEIEDGALRLYFTYHVKGAKRPTLYSATASDGNISSPFVVEQTPALSIDENLLDPSVVFFDGKWHHYTWRIEDEDNYHSVSDDGISFTRQDDISLPMDFLGEVVAVDSGLRFYGTGKGGIFSATSSDGYTWEMDEGSRFQGGADPGVAKLSDGTYLMVYTSMNFN